MERIIHAMMATLTSFLTCIAPVYALENATQHFFNCEGELNGESLELVGKFSGNEGMLAYKGAGPLKLYEANFFQPFKPPFALEVSAGDLNIHLPQFFNAISPAAGRAVMSGRSIRPPVIELTCNTSCTACLSQSYPTSEYCIQECNCIDHPAGCFGW